MQVKTWATGLYIISFFLVFGCSPAISPFDQYAYTHTTSIKVDAMNVMDLATEDYTAHKKEIAAVQTGLRIRKEQAKK